MSESSVSHNAESLQNFACSGLLCYVFHLTHVQITFRPYFLCTLFYSKSSSHYITLHHITSHYITLHEACKEGRANDEFRMT